MLAGQQCHCLISDPSTSFKPIEQITSGLVGVFFVCLFCFGRGGDWHGNLFRDGSKVFHLCGHLSAEPGLLLSSKLDSK